MKTESGDIIAYKCLRCGRYTFAGNKKCPNCLNHCKDPTTKEVILIEKDNERRDE